jgi:5-methylcytosine-specific restriction endonuclease McrA
MIRNQFRIPKDVILRLRARDKKCVYCGKRMLLRFDVSRRRDCASIEHLNCNGPFYWDEDGQLKEQDLVLCCGSCNSSRGNKTLREWFASPYCIERNINSRTVAAPVRRYLRHPKSRE